MGLSPKLYKNHLSGVGFAPTIQHHRAAVTEGYVVGPQEGCSQGRFDEAKRRVSGGDRLLPPLVVSDDDCEEALRFTGIVASEILATHPRTLMMYEHLNMIKPKRTATNRRRYSQRDLMKLQSIQTLTRKHGVNLAGVRYILALLKQLQVAGLKAPDALKELDVTLLDV